MEMIKSWNCKIDLIKDGWHLNYTSHCYVYSSQRELRIGKRIIQVNSSMSTSHLTWYQIQNKKQKIDQ